MSTTAVQQERGPRKPKKKILNMTPLEDCRQNRFKFKITNFSRSSRKTQYTLKCVVDMQGITYSIYSVNIETQTIIFKVYLKFFYRPCIFGHNCTNSPYFCETSAK